MALEVFRLTKLFSQGGGVQNLTFTLPIGKLALLAGANGAGKSLTLRLLSGLENADSGTINVDECLTSPLGTGSIGLLFQDAYAQVVGDTVWEDALFGPECLGLDSHECKHRATVALQIMQLWDKKDENPLNLSGGELRRLGIAGLLANDFKYLLLDEPFANLDYPSSLQLLNTLKQLLQQKKGLLVATHDLDQLWELSHELHLMDKGLLTSYQQPFTKPHSFWHNFQLKPPLSGLTNDT
jgi:biotin transport system ATP-binding protein